MTWPSARTLWLAAAIVGGALVLGGAGALWYVSSQRAAAAAYAEALTQVQRSRASNNAASTAAAASQLEATLQQYPSSRLAGDAAYELANLRFDDHQYAAARNAYTIALARGAPTIRTLAQAGVAYSWEAEKDYAKAAAAFQSALGAVGTGDFLYEQLALDLARTQELAGQREQAIETYRRVLKDVPKTRRGDEIRMRLAALGADAR